MTIGTKILALDCEVAQNEVTNEDLTKILDTSDEWITARTGIKERHIASGNENSFTLGLKSAQEALDKAGLKGEDIDLIIAATSNPYNIYPSTACSISAAIIFFISCPTRSCLCDCSLIAIFITSSFKQLIQHSINLIKGLCYAVTFRRSVHKKYIRRKVTSMTTLLQIYNLAAMASIS